MTLPRAAQSALDLVLERAFAPVAEAIRAGRIPGAALGLVTPAGGRAAVAAGSAMVTPQRIPLDRTTWFDLASLTKPIVTTTEILHLAEEGLLDLDDPLAKHLPELASPAVRLLPIRKLLSHESGLVAHERIHSWGEGPETLRAMVLAHDWPIGQPVYSDINFILLGFVVEALRGQPLVDTSLPPGLSFRPNPVTVAATEECPTRGRVLRGEVHDENAWALGGAGHAGLFGSIDGVLDFARDLMAGKVLGAAALEEMRRPQSATRVLGWERRHAHWTGGQLCSPDTIGHLGFTGTGLWIDFARGIAWSLLTNRVHPSRHRETGIMDLRRSVGNLVSAAWAG